MNRFVTFQRWTEIYRSMLPFARRHWRWLLVGGLMSLLVVGIRLSLPWFFRGMLEPLLVNGGAREELAEELAQPWLFGVLFLVLLVALGFADFLMRLKFAQFAIGTVRDLRARAFRSAMQIDPRIRPSGPGDLVARLIGDTARVKEGLKGFLVHVMTNGLMLAGVSAVILWVDARLGAILAAAYVLIAIVVAYGTTRIYHRSLKLRIKEARIAESIHESWRHDSVDPSFDDVNRSSGKHEATATRLQGRVTWAAHAIFGLAVLLLIWLGARGLANGNVSGSDLLVIGLYALMTRAPVVQLARQGTRTGKILACAGRLEQVLRTGQQQESAAPLPALLREIRVERARVNRPASRGGGYRLKVEALRVPAGSRVAVVGASAAGKSTLLQLLAGALHPGKGEVWWDEVRLTEVSRRSLRERITLIPQEPRWPRQPLWRLLGLRDATLKRATRRVLKKCGAWRLIGRLPEGLATAVPSERLSAGERRALVLGGAMLTGASVILLDDPFNDLSPRQAKRRMRALLARRGDATVIVASAELPSPRLFDRVLELEEGRIVFDGAPCIHRARLRAVSGAPVPEQPAAAAFHANGRRNGVQE